MFTGVLHNVCSVHKLEFYTRIKEVSYLLKRSSKKKKQKTTILYQRTNTSLTYHKDLTATNFQNQLNATRDGSMLRIGTDPIPYQKVKKTTVAVRADT